MGYCEFSLRSRVAAIAWLLCSLGEVCCAAAEQSLVEFRLHSPGLPANASVYIAGSEPGLGHWKPNEQRMKYAGENVWTLKLALTKGKTIEYKYTLGSWAQEGADEAGKPLANFMYTIDGPGEIADRIDFWTKPGPRKSVGQITGTVKYHRQLAGKGIRSRNVVVWLPPGYEQSTNRYPVLYMHDGQNLFDPSTSAFGVDWQVDETCARLISEQAIPPLIVVGIYNTADRTQEYLPGKLGIAYRSFVINTLKPLIDEQYRTNPQRESTLVGGSSAGGLCAFILAWEHSDVFSKAICMSPAFLLHNKEKQVQLDYVATVSDSQPSPLPLAIYIDNGGVGLEKTLQPGVDAMLAALRNRGLVDNNRLFWVIDHNARHSESAWGQRFPDAIQFLLE